MAGLNDSSEQETVTHLHPLEQMNSLKIGQMPHHELKPKEGL